MTELDRAALRHAYLLLRSGNPGASRVLDTGGAVSWRLHVEVLRATYGDDEEHVEPRMLRARLALAIRAILRADRGDCGRARCSGCRCVTRNNAAIVRGWCSCCEERAEWRRDRITPLWERARRSA